MARKAADLYEQQQAIEALVSQRWDSAKGSGAGCWPVAALPAVAIDSFGRFPFVLAKAGDRLGAKKLLVRRARAPPQRGGPAAPSSELFESAVSLNSPRALGGSRRRTGCLSSDSNGAAARARPQVRGRNGATEAQLVKGMLKEVADACGRQRLPPADLAVLGGGTMEWCRERDRLINVIAGAPARAPRRPAQGRALRVAARMAGLSSWWGGARWPLRRCGATVFRERQVVC